MAVAGVLCAAERQMNFGADRCRIDIANASVKLLHRVEGVVNVLRVDRRREAVCNTVDDVYGFVESRERNDARHRAKDLFLSDAHLRADIRKHCRLDEIAFCIVAFCEAFAAACKCGFVLFFSDVDVAEDLVHRLLVNNGPDFGLGIEAVADAEFFNFLNKLFAEFLVNFFVNNKP